MLVSYNWLKQYTNVEDNANALAEKITRGGIEVEGVEYLAEEISGVVVGYVESKEKHPDAEKLNVCQVNVGEEENLQIVCGAPNVEAGQKVVVALSGAMMPSGLLIKKSKLRGVESNGMLCSKRELGLPQEEARGILVLDADTKVGTRVKDLNLK